MISTAGFDTGLASTLVLEHTNAARRRHGLPALAPSQELETVAGAHSRDMAERNYFSHTTRGLLKRESFGERARSAGITRARMAENIAMLPALKSGVVYTRRNPDGSREREVTSENYTYDGLAQAAVEKWMESPGHRRNILDPALEQLGVGCAIATRGDIPYIYITQNFGSTR
jgi:uncharacterized protein YkwD